MTSIPGGQDYSPPQVVVKQPPTSSSTIKQQHKQLTQDQHHNSTHQQIIQQQAKKKFTNYTGTRLNAMLFKNKEQLKKDIAKKRSLLEKDLMHEIQRDIESLKKQAALKLGSEHATAKIMTSSSRQHQDNSNSSANINSKADHEGSRKRKADASPALPPAAGKMGGVQPPRKKAKAEKNERLYCLCKSRYDPTK